MKNDKHLKRAKAGGSAVARASYDRPGGPQGKLGKDKNKGERKQVKQMLKYEMGEYDDS